MTQHMQLSPEALEILAHSSGKVIELDPETGRARLVHEGVVYTSEPEGGAA